ncbi:MAG: hypothetical protein SGI86_20375 [Deltaproteobacteria bacterium]|nr:hypothetical protein [Deltaproteobacteria bacterium]
MFGFGKRQPQLVLWSHWCKLIENLAFSPEEFYDRTTAGLLAREIPKLKEQRVRINEGGLLSAKRLYLRLKRERIVIDICGAPFGTGFFVSWRLLEVPLRVNWFALIAITAVCLYAAWFLMSGQPSIGRSYRFDRMARSVDVWQVAYSLVILLVWLVIVGALLRKVIAFALKDVDGAILQIPVIGPLYERFIRQMTYYRVDIALMFQQAVHAAVIEVVDEITQAKGLPLLTADERKPIFNDLYRR